MIKLFNKLVNWCFAPKRYKDEIIDNKFYIPCSQVFCLQVKEKEKVL